MASKYAAAYSPIINANPLSIRTAIPHLHLMVNKKAQIVQKYTSNPQKAILDTVLNHEEQIDRLWQTVPKLRLQPVKGDVGERGQDGQDGYTPIKGVDYFDGEQGEPGPIGPKGERGEPGESIVGPAGKDGKDGSPDTPNEIKLKLESLEGDDRLDASAIKGLPEAQDFIDYFEKLDQGVKNRVIGSNYLKRTGPVDQRWHGAGSGGTTLELQVDGVANGDQTLLNLISGTNITLTDDGVGGVTIDAANVIETVSDTNTVDLVIVGTDLSANVRYVDSATINFSDSAAGLTGITIQQMSITADASGLKLVNDELAPGNSEYYGTNGAGTKGYFPLPTDFITAVSDTNTINLTVTGTTLSADLLYIDSASINFSDSGAGFTGVVIPAGSDGNIQYNNGGVLGGDSLLNWDDTTKTLAVGVSDTMVVHGVTVTSQIQTNSDTLAVYESHTHSDTAAAGATFYGARSRGTNAAPTVVASGDLVRIDAAVGYDGTDYETLGYQIWAVDGTPGADDMPGRWMLYTTADGAFTPTERLRIASTGAWGLSGANYGISGQVLTSAGSGSAPTWQTPSGGTVTGTGTDNHIVRWDGTGVPVIQDSQIILGDGGDMTEVGNITGEAGGITITGGTAASNDLILESTSNATKGQIVARSSVELRDGSSTDLALRFESDPDSGVYSAGGDTWEVVSGGVRLAAFTEAVQDVVLINPTGIDIDFTVYSDDDSAGLLHVDGDGDYVSVGAGEFASSFGNFKWTVKYGGSTNGHSNYGGINLERIYVGNTADIINNSIYDLFNWQQTSSAKTFTKDLQLQEIIFDVNGGDITIGQSARHVKLKLASTGSGTLTSTDYRFDHFSLDNDAGSYRDIWDVHKWGLHHNNWCGTTTITHAASGSPDSATITYPFTLPNSNYELLLTAYSALNVDDTTPLRQYDIYVYAHIKSEAKLTTSATAYITYHAYDSGGSSAWAGSWNNYNDMVTALSLDETDIPAQFDDLNWAIRGYFV